MRKKIRLALDQLVQELSIIESSDLLKYQGGSSSGLDINHIEAYLQNIVNVKNVSESSGISSGQTMANWIGGNVAVNYNHEPAQWSNTCALSMSLALNMMGGDYAVSAGSSSGTVSGNHVCNNIKESYFYRVEDMKTYLSEKYGSAEVIRSSSSIPSGVKGFIFYDNVNMGTGAFDHINYWNGNKAISADYSGYSGTIYFIRTN